MLARMRKAMDEREEGFTLIELLVVMIIIGILAAIAIPVFLSQKDKAKDTSAKADVSVIGKDLSAYYVDGTGTLTSPDRRPVHHRRRRNATVDRQPERRQQRGDCEHGGPAP